MGMALGSRHAGWACKPQSSALPASRPPSPLLTTHTQQVLDVLQLSRATLRKIQQNMWWAAGYNLIGIPLAAGAALPFTGLALTPSMSGACWKGVLCNGGAVAACCTGSAEQGVCVALV